MFHRLTAYLVCIAMFIMPRTVYAVEDPDSAVRTEVELLEKYPNAKVIRISPEDYSSLKKELRRRGYRQSEVVRLQLAENNTGEVVVKKQRNNPDSVDECTRKSSSEAGEESFRVMLDITDDMLKSGNGSSGENAPIVFIIIGTVVVVVWTLYVFKYLYDVSLGNAPCGRWDELTVVTGGTSTSDKQHVRFNGLRYSTGFNDGSLDVGIGLELGQADILLSEIGTLELKGRYWLLGPILRWRMTRDSNPSYFQMNFFGGSTEHDEVGVLARASLGLLFGIGESLQLGLNWGVVNIDLNENQGVITERDQYHYLYGINVGYSF